MAAIRHCVFLALLAMKPVQVVSDELTTLYVGSLLPLSNYWWGAYGRFYVQFLEWVFEEINNRTDLLPGYRLQLVAEDTEGNAGLGVKRLIELLDQGRPKIALIGAGLSDELSLIGQVTQHYYIPVLSFAATTSHSLDRDLYKSVYITNYLGESVNPARIAIMKAFQWTHVATVIYKDQVFETQITSFHRSLAENNFTLVTSAIITDLEQVAEHMIRLKQYDARIIMAAFRSNTAPYIFCQAYKHGLYGRSYQWILTGPSMYDSWIRTFFIAISQNKSKIDCTKDEIVEASRNYFVVDDVYLRPDLDTVTISGKTAAEYDVLANAFAKKSKVIISRTHPYGYDAAWALALTLNMTQQKLSTGILGSKTRLADFNYSRSDMFDLMLLSFQEVTFEGVSGTVSFNQHGQRVGPHQIAQFYNDTKTIVGNMNDLDELIWKVPTSSLFEDRHPPRDRFRYISKKLPPEPSAIIVVLIINTIGLIVGIGFLLFNIIYRNNKHIKMSSPSINNLIVMGCLLMYVFVYVLTADYASWLSGSDDIICMVRLWLACIGFTLSFGALFAKTWRVHALFRNNQIKRKIIKDLQLFGQVLVLVLVDMAILVPWSTLFGLIKEEYQIKTEGQSTNEQITYTYSVCTHRYEVYWYMAEYVYKGLLLVFGAFLAWETRMVTIPALNDSKLIGFCIYNIAIVCALVVPVTYALGQDRKTLGFILVAVFVSLCTSLVLCILFIPKVRLRNRVDEVHFVKSLNTGETTCQVRNGLVQDQLRVPRRPGRGQLKNRLVLKPPDRSNSEVFTVDAPLAGVKNGQTTKEKIVGHTHDGRERDRSETAGYTEHDGKERDRSETAGYTEHDGREQDRSETAGYTEHDGREQDRSETAGYTEHDGRERDRSETAGYTELGVEVMRLNSRLSEEMRAISRLRADLLRQSNNTINFHKIGQEYILFRSTQSRTETQDLEDTDKIEESQT